MDSTSQSYAQVTPEEMLRLYMRNRCLAARSQQPIRPRPTGILAPLSLSQEPIFWRAQEKNLPLLYNESVTIHRSGDLDVNVLKRAISEIIRRHEAWRTTFKIADGMPRQIVHRPANVHI